ncbi:FtsX-like permease family protein [Paenibacillus qinlingensis]|uniref:Putative hemin transport system permease protein HrtB n=1 Tax=Paenibacillus qinlingensis TaxID=1837343 RepID=A0ABU1NUY8_9BACL|nr:FtsX-like permease family protein [Paenibacillus qinlingensis]MDR6551290.1 putative ABC transport system permease protein [Paenibacillus qinlingensis]
MSVISLLWSQLWHRKTLSLLTICSVAITAALVVFLLICSQGVERGAENGYGPFDVTIGAKGSSTQLALNTYYHIGAPTGNIPITVLDDVRKNDFVDSAYAMTTGDNYQGFPIIGMEPGYFLTRYGADKQMAQGALYGKQGETIVGSYVASSLGLSVGDTFVGAHGLIQEAGLHEEEEEGEEEGHHAFTYTVVGILPTLHTSDDRAVFTTLDYAWAVHESQQSGKHDITAILVKPKSLLGAQTIKTEFAQYNNVQSVFTSKAVADVVNVVDQGTQAVKFVTIICILLAAGSILLSLVAAVHERKRDVALLRLIGKSKQFIWFSLIGEGVLLTIMGLIVGIALGHIGAFLSSDVVFAQTGLQIQAAAYLPGEFGLIVVTLLIAVAASIGPAIQAYRVDPLQLFRS